MPDKIKTFYNGVNKMIKSYEDLEVYIKGYELSKIIHQLSQRFPKEERYEVGSQIRRAALSVPLNIAEGYGRKDSVADFKRFLQIAQGSTNEVKVLLEFCKDLRYIEEERAKKLKEEYNYLGKQINTLIQKWR